MTQHKPLTDFWTYGNKAWCPRDDCRMWDRCVHAMTDFHAKEAAEERLPIALISWHPACFVGPLRVVGDKGKRDPMGGVE